MFILEKDPVLPPSVGTWPSYACGVEVFWECLPDELREIYHTQISKKKKVVVKMLLLY